MMINLATQHLPALDLIVQHGATAVDLSRPTARVNANDRSRTPVPATSVRRLLRLGLVELDNPEAPAATIAATPLGRDLLARPAAA